MRQEKFKEMDRNKEMATLFFSFAITVSGFFTILALVIGGNFQFFLFLWVSSFILANTLGY